MNGAVLCLQTKQTIDKLQVIVSSDGRFRNLREALHRCDPPCIPYLGMYLTDLSFIEESTPNFSHDKLLNFSKMRMVRLVELCKVQDTTLVGVTQKLCLPAGSKQVRIALQYTPGEKQSARRYVTGFGFVSTHVLLQIAHVIREVRNFQQVPYKIEHVSKVTNYLQDPLLVLDEEEMYRLSLEIEPRASRLSAANTAAIVSVTSSHNRLFPSTSHDR